MSTPNPENPRISLTALGRLRALRDQELRAASQIASGDSYPDFFVEGSGPPWHERWPEVISAERAEDLIFSSERMTHVDRLRLSEIAADYPDFFVEGSGPPWHERWPEVISGEAFGDPAIRVRALSQLRVVDAYLRLRGE